MVSSYNADSSGGRVRKLPSDPIRRKGAGNQGGAMASLCQCGQFRVGGRCFAVRHPDAMEAYLRQVLSQIRWKRARNGHRTGAAANHLEDQYQALLEEGLPPTEAEAETVRQMGDPVSVGKALDALHRPRRSGAFSGRWPAFTGLRYLSTWPMPAFSGTASSRPALAVQSLAWCWASCSTSGTANCCCDRPVLLAVLLGLVPLFARRFYSSSFDLTFDQGLCCCPWPWGLWSAPCAGTDVRISACLQLEFLLILDCIRQNPSILPVLFFYSVSFCCSNRPLEIPCPKAVSWVWC